MRKSCEIELEPRGAQIPARPIDAAICLAVSYSVLERQRLLAPSVVREMVFELQTRIAVVHLPPGTPNFVQPYVLLIFCSTFFKL